MESIRRKIRLRFKKSIKWFKGWSRIETWPQNIFYHHGVRIFLLLSLAWLALVLTPGRRTNDPFFDVQAGSVADRDVTAPFDFPVHKSQTELEQERREAADRVKPVLEFLPGVRDVAIQEESLFFDLLKKIRSDTLVKKSLVSWNRYLDLTRNQNKKFKIKPVVLQYLYSADSLLTLSDDEIIYLFDPVRSSLLRNRLKDYLVSRLREGIISDAALSRIENEEVLLRRDGEEKVVESSSLNSLSRVIEQSMSEVIDPEYQEVSKSLFVQELRRFIRANIIYNWTETERLRQVAAAAVKPVRDEMVLKDEKILSRGEKVTPEQMERLDNLSAELEKRELVTGEADQIRHGLGIFTVYLLLLLILGIYIYFYQREDYQRFSKLLIIAISIALVLLCSSLILGRPELPGYLIPVAVAAMLIAYLLDDQLAMVATFCLSLMIGVQANFSSYLVLLSLAGGIAAAISVRRIESRRAQYLPILYVAAAYVLVLFAVDFAYRGEDFNTVLRSAGWCTLNATLSTFIAIPLLPLFESVFKITSNFTLLELGDLNRPLLKRLSLEAPGTYHHSLIIGSLAEAAAAGIGANPIYARVASYYHDIGKMRKPEYFIENQSGKPNPHNKLSPKMSSLIIASHVKEGVDLARKARLPECIIDIIREHHGNQPISFFYSKEKEQNPDTTLREGDFCYPGPKPMSKEAAIIMLADAVESASRSLSEPTVSRIKSLIRGLIEAKLRDGQLDYADLTLRDLTRIGDEFFNILIGVHHHRIEYPSSGEKPQDAKGPNSRTKIVSGPDGKDETGGVVLTPREDVD